ncbi:MAG: hypothetical protein ACD_75C01094G0010 [uncultured bacterium]|nr:MAG: hypothetical protein ACD_75C01094G0010 [uncultured bacterium]
MAKNIFNNTFGQFLKRNRARVALLGVGLVFLLFVGSGLLYFQKKHRIEKEPIETVPKSVELNVRQKEGADKQAGEPARQSAPFFLRPSPDELLQQLASMENLNENVAAAKFTGLKVLWPVYYFSSQDAGGGKATLLLDVSENGFGILIESEVELSAYPSLNTLQAGQKIWIGGEILAVDPAGTGTIFLKVEHVGFNEEQPLPAGIETKKK